jgi:hypothetical protein
MQHRAEMLGRINEWMRNLAHQCEMTAVHYPGRFEATMGEILRGVQDTVTDRSTATSDTLLDDQRARAQVPAPVGPLVHQRTARDGRPDEG